MLEIDNLETSTSVYQHRYSNHTHFRLPMDFIQLHLFHIFSVSIHKSTRRNKTQTDFFKPVISPSIRLALFFACTRPCRALLAIQEEKTILLYKSKQLPDQALSFEPFGNFSKRIRTAKTVCRTRYAITTIAKVHIQSF